MSGAEAPRSTLQPHFARSSRANTREDITNVSRSRTLSVSFNIGFAIQTRSRSKKEKRHAAAVFVSAEKSEILKHARRVRECVRVVCLL